MTVGLAILNQKGGTGKTPVTIHLAGALAALGKRVLVLDLDGQADLTTGIGFKRDVYGADGDSILSLLLDLKSDPNALIRNAPHDDFDVIPGNMQMYLAEQSLMGQRNREGRLARVFQRIQTDYEYILADCPPALNVVTDNALLACRRVLIPARMHRTYRGSINNLMGQINTLREAFETNIDIVGVVPVGFEQQTDQQAFMEALREGAPQLLAPVLRKRQTLIEDARDAGHSIFSYVPGSSYRKKAQRESQEDYLALADFVIRRIAEEVS